MINDNGPMSLSIEKKILMPVWKSWPILPGWESHWQVSPQAALAPSPPTPAFPCPASGKFPLLLHWRPSPGEQHSWQGAWVQRQPEWGRDSHSHTSWQAWSGSLLWGEELLVGLRPGKLGQQQHKWKRSPCFFLKWMNYEKTNDTSIFKRTWEVEVLIQIVLLEETPKPQWSEKMLR